MKKPTFYVTTPIYYVNDKPHIGHAYTTIACDVIARYKRMVGYDVMFLTGTDEHGLKIEQSAEKQGVKPKELADINVARYQALWEKLGISNSDFIRTTESRHKEAVWKLFDKMKANGDIYLGEYEGWYCTPCESYWTETQVAEGNLCPDCGRATSRLKESSYFFKMSKFQDRLLKHIEDNPDFIRPESRRNEIKSFIKEGLRDLSISRVNFSWGIPVKEDPKHIIYVWIDALANYLTAIDYFNDGDKKRYWPADFHIVGKDIIRFHTVYWPSMLMSAGLELPKSIFAHGWWTVDGNKMSKSMGNAIDPNFIVEKLSVDTFRYFVMREVPFGLDGDFSYKALIHRINGDLANDLGNLLSRTLGMVERYFGGVIPEYKESDALDEKIFSQLSAVIDVFDNHISNLAFNKALVSLWEVISALNKYIDESAPWALAKDEGKKDRLASVLYTPLDALRVISYLVSPFMPTIAQEIRRQLTMPSDIEVISLEDLKLVKKLVAGKKIEDVKAIFPRIDEAILMAELQPKAEEKATEAVDGLITFADFEKVSIKAGKILNAENVKKSDKLLKLSIDAGAGAKTIVSGIAKSYKPEELIGCTVAVVTNLAPAKLMGIESNGMVLAVFDGERHNVIKLGDDIKAGTRIK